MLAKSSPCGRCECAAENILIFCGDLTVGTHQAFIVKTEHLASRREPIDYTEIGSDSGRCLWRQECWSVLQGPEDRRFGYPGIAERCRGVAEVLWVFILFFFPPFFFVAGHTVGEKGPRGASLWWLAVAMLGTNGKSIRTRLVPESSLCFGRWDGPRGYPEDQRPVSPLFGRSVACLFCFWDLTRSRWLSADAWPSL